jgi:hypothetical protein
MTWIRIADTIPLPTTVATIASVVIFLPGFFNLVGFQIIDLVTVGTNGNVTSTGATVT